MKVLAKTAVFMGWFWSLFSVPCSGQVWKRVRMPGLYGENDYTALVWHGGIGRIWCWSLTGGYEPEVSEWDGERWIPREKGKGGPLFPPNPDWFSFVYEKDQDRIVMYGGRDNNFNFAGRTILWKDGRWITLDLKPSPGDRKGFPSINLAYDPVRKEVVCFCQDLGPNSTIIPSTWLFDGKNLKWNRSMIKSAPLVGDRDHRLISRNTHIKIHCLVRTLSISMQHGVDESLCNGHGQGHPQGATLKTAIRGAANDIAHHMVYQVRFRRQPHLQRFHHALFEALRLCGIVSESHCVLNTLY